MPYGLLRGGGGGQQSGTESERLGETCKLTQPTSVQVDRHEHRRNREEVDHGVDLQPEPQLVVGCYKLSTEANTGTVFKNNKRILVLHNSTTPSLASIQSAPHVLLRWRRHTV